MTERYYLPSIDNYLPDKVYKSFASMQPSPQSAETWLKNLDPLIQKYCQQWEFSDLEPAIGGASLLYLYCETGSKQTVLKIPTTITQGRKEHGIERYIDQNGKKLNCRETIQE